MDVVKVVWGVIILMGGLAGAGYGVYQGVEIYQAYQQVQGLAQMAERFGGGSDNRFAGIARLSEQRLWEHTRGQLPWIIGEIVLGALLMVSGIRLIRHSRRAAASG
jgi:hypothetical protein